MRDDLIQILEPGVDFHVLRDERGIYLIDAGFVSGIDRLRRALRERKWDREKIIGIIVTHGHLDHILNVGKLSQQTGAWIAAPRLDGDHYQGHAKYHGLSRVTGVLEAIGRPVLGFTSFTPDRLLDDGDTLDVWHGLRAVSLPGHTAGHMGFYCEKLKLLFSADLYGSHARFTRLPPAIFNSNQKQIPSSIAKALELDLCGVLPNHGDGATPEVNLERLRKLRDSLLR